MEPRSAAGRSRRRGPDPGPAAPGGGLRGCRLPQPQVYDEPMEQGAFIPPQAERAMRPARMPRIDELPMPAQNQIRASRGEEPAQRAQALSLIQRLATVGFGRREEPQQAPRRAAPGGPAPADVPGSRRVRPPAGSASGAASGRRARLGSGAPGIVGRRSAGDSGLPAPPGQLSWALQSRHDCYK